MTDNDLQEMFTEYVEKESIFRDKSLLDTSYIPDDILHRGDQIQELASILRPALKGEDPSNLFIYGTVGTGKTLCVKHVTEELKRAAKRVEQSLTVVRLNCKKGKKADTEYRLIAALARGLDEDIDIPSTGLPTNDVYDRFFEALREGDDVVILVLDEIDALVKKVDDNVLYTLTRMNEEVEGTKVSVVGISNDLNFTDYLDSRVKSSLSEEELIFPTYNAHELKEILQQRTDEAFHEGVVTEGVLSKCAAIAAQENGDARQALDLIRVAGELAERSNETEVTLEFIGRAQEKIEKDRMKETIRSQPKQSKILLHAILDKHQTIGGKLATGDIYSAYKACANEVGANVITQRRVSDLIGELDMLGVINAQVISKGHHGRTREVTVDMPDDMVDDLATMLKESVYM